MSLANTKHKMTGLLASQAGEELPLTVLESNAGYYIGTSNKGLPYSRESVEYFSRSPEAKEALKQGSWTQRLSP